jgi:hypothetical protein
MHARLRIRALLALALLSGCESAATGPKLESALTLDFDGPALVPFTTATVTVEGPTTKKVSGAPGSQVTITDLPAGTYQVAVEGFAGSTLAWYDETTATVAAGQTARATVSANVAFRVTSHALSATSVVVGQTVRVSWPAVPNAASYAVEWIAQGGGATNSRTTTATTLDVDLGAVGTYNLTVVPITRLGSRGTGSTASAVTIRTVTKFTLTVLKNGAGTITSNPAGISLAPTANTATASFDSATVVTLTASAGRLGWGGSCSGSTTTCVVNMNTARTVTIGYAEATGASDLTLTSVTAPSSGLTGGTITVSASIANQGNASATAYRVGWYVSTDATITTADVFTGWTCDHAGLSVGATDTCSGPIGIPSTLSVGAYYVGAIVDDQGQVAETNEVNNGRAAVTPTSFSAGLVDFIITSLTVPSTGTIGGMINVTVIVQNQGNIASPTSRTQYYLSTDQTITQTDIDTGWGCNIPSLLANGGTYTCSGGIGIPSTVAPGTYYLGAIADDGRVVSESNEVNNTRAAGPIVLAR